MKHDLSWLEAFAVAFALVGLAFALVGITVALAWCQINADTQAQITERLKIQQGIKK